MMRSVHETIAIERSFAAAPDRLFAAFADPRARERWSAPNADVEIRILQSDLRTGGSETARCGPAGGPLNWEMRVAYHLVEPPSVISFSEELWDGEQLLTVALITFDIAGAENGGSLLRLTDQVTSFAGEDALQGHRDGYAAALQNLAASLA
ncbi:SRPBCC domain-containing protein [Nitratireductor sp. XY-223]|uniref:SRPBCC domain-containing protein n=1 Tax=Nitratireductor sp. XY-223 TaxID=2561926 RepID=UPI0010AACCFE|nr:SRPBCC domain-containing protein [Nitratireductor sp. XY-223]